MNLKSFLAGVLGATLSARMSALSKFTPAVAHNQTKPFAIKGKRHHSLKVRANRRKAKRAA